MSKIVFKTSKTVPGDGMRVTRVKAGVVEMLVQTNPEKWSELVGADAPIVTPPPIEPPPPPGPIDPPPVVPPVTPPTGTITPAQFGAALAAAKGGETIQLAAGVLYSMPSSPKFASPVTIKGGVFATLNLQGAENITFDGALFDYKFRQGDPLHQTSFEVTGGKNIAFLRCIFDGDLVVGSNPIDNGYANGNGLVVMRVDGITVADCVVKTWMRGLIFDTCVNVKVLRNDVSGIRCDGMDFIQVQKVLIEGNTIHDFASAPGSEDHSDFIQFWTTGTTAPSTDIVIRNNRLIVGQGTWAQSLFMRNELVDQGQATFAAMAYRNILIESNTISNAHVHGITVGETAGLIIRKNLVQAAKLNLALKYNADYVAQYGAGSGIMRPAINAGEGSVGFVLDGNAVLAIGQPVPAGVGAA